MTAPVATTRQTSSEKRLTDGFQTLITIALDPDIAIWEKEVTPPGLQADEGNDTTTQQNNRYRTKSPRGLVTMTDVTVVCQYGVAAYDQIEAVINRATTITIEFPDHSTLAFYGYVSAFIPDALKEGEPPMATMTIVCTNMDPSTCTEEDPVYTAGAGTGAC